jgi:putative transposase
MPESEMDGHLGYVKHSPEGDRTGTSRNGYGKKTISSEWGESEISVPRDRNGSFSPKVVEKRQTRTDDIENRIISMYAKGISTRDIEDQLRDIYGIEASPALISSITDKILPQAAESQSRPLDELYPAVFFDGIWFKVRKDGGYKEVRVFRAWNKYGRSKGNPRNLDERDGKRFVLRRYLQ